MLPTAVGVWPREQQVPHHIRWVDLELLVRVVRAGGVDEHLKVRVLLKDGRIALGEGRDDLKGALDDRAHIEVLVVPQHLHARGATSWRLSVRWSVMQTSDVAELCRPWRISPHSLVEISVDRDWL